MLGEKLKALREQQGYTQIDIAKRLGVSPATYNRYEKNVHTPDIEMLIRIASIFEVSLDSLCGNSVKKKKDVADLNAFLNNTEIIFDGEMHSLDEEDREKLHSALEYVFWQAKKKNKRS